MSYMGKIVNIQKAISLASKLKEKNQTIVLAGGCFDIIHIGHIKFLQQTKNYGVLFILLENDEKVRKLKGNKHPYFQQQERAEVLASIESIDYVVLLPERMNDRNYEEIVMKIKPDIIAVTENDPLYEKKRKQAEKVGGKIRVIPFIKTFSSSKIVKLLGVD